LNKPYDDPTHAEPAVGRPYSLGPVSELSNCLRYTPILGTRPSRPHAGRRPAVQIERLSPDGSKLQRTYSPLLGFEIGAHALHATAATNALDHQADIAKVQEWLGHANVATTRIYDHRKTLPEDSSPFKVAY